MAVYKGASGIDKLMKVIDQRVNKMIHDSIINITHSLIDASPIGLETYPTRNGVFKNDAGDYINSWSVSIGSAKPVHAAANPNASDAISSALSASKAFDVNGNSGDIYIVNGSPQAYEVEYGWESNEFRDSMGWNNPVRPDGYRVRETNLPVAMKYLEFAAKEAKGIN